MQEEEPAQKHHKTEAAAVGDKTKGSAFFASLKLAPSEHLDAKGKVKCETCGRNQKYYCYSCMKRVGPAENTPVVRLPVGLEM
jgi:hypothetical protein